MALLTMTQVRERVPVSRTTIYALMGAGQFPAAQKVKGRGNRLFWAEADVSAWLKANPGAGA